MPEQIVCVHRGQSGDDRLWYATYDGSWTADILLGNDARSLDKPGVAAIDNLLYCVHRGEQSDDRLWWTTFDPANAAWTADQPLPNGARSSVGPGVATYLGQLFCVYKGANDNALRWCSFDPVTQQWTNEQQLPSADTYAPPTILMWNNILWCVYRGAHDQNLWCTTYFASQWSSSVRFPHGNESGDGPALVVGPNHLMCIHRGKHTQSVIGQLGGMLVPTEPNQAMWWSDFEGFDVATRGQWSADQHIYRNRSATSPAAVFYAGQVICVHRGETQQDPAGGARYDDHLYYMTYNGRLTWFQDIKFPQGNLSHAGVGLAVLDFP